MCISFFSSDGTLNKVYRNHTIFGIEREEPSRFSFLVSHVLPIRGECGLMVWEEERFFFQKGTPSFVGYEKEKKRLLEE